MTTNAMIGLYGNREIGFAYLADTRGSSVFGDYNPGDAKLAHEDATTALFTACAELSARKVTGRANVQIDRKLPDGRTLVRSADIEIGNPPYFGSIRWTETVVG